MDIEFLSLESDINPENDNIDVLVRLDDSREYLFLVATPNNIYDSMDRERADHYFGVPPLFVRRLTKSNVECAVAALLDEPQWPAIYGTLQVRK